MLKVKPRCAGARLNLGIVKRKCIVKTKGCMASVGFFVFVSLVVSQSAAYSQSTLREKMRERWFKRQKVSRDFGARDYHFSLEHDGLTRKYNVHLPPSYDKNVPTPVVIYIHGGGGDMRAAYMDKVDKAADKFGFILVVPEGTGEVKFGHLRGSWNGGKWSNGECCGSADDVGFISKMIDEVKLKFNIDENRIYATGISNGG